MAAIKYIRFLTYAMLIAVCFLIFRTRPVIPIHLMDPVAQAEIDSIKKIELINTEEINNRECGEITSVYDKAHAAVLFKRAVKGKSFWNTRMSGQQVVATAKAASSKDNELFSDLGDPHISLTEKNDKLVWYVTFYSIPPAPGNFLTVEIDDESGATIIHPGM